MEQHDKRILERIGQITRSAPELGRRYREVRRTVRAFARPAFYEISSRCNLFCEGCYYFEDERNLVARDETDIRKWEAFFQSESDRGVTMAYFVGAEPALEQDRLLAAADKFPYGNIGTNGTVRIHPDVPYRIEISVWGDDETDTRLRGASTQKKMLRNYAGDPRALVLFTLSPWNIHTVPGVVKMLADNGLPVTFNLFSSTRTYDFKIDTEQEHDSKYYRVATQEDRPAFDEETLKRLHDTVEQVMADHPETVIYSSAFNRRMTRPGPIHDIDPITGIAEACGSRIKEPLRYFSTAQEPLSIKCCTPDVDCATCRMYSGGWSSLFRPKLADTESVEAFEEWLEMLAVLERVFLLEKGSARARSAA